MWLWIFAVLFLVLVWTAWFFLQPTDIAPDVESIFPTWIAIAITVAVVLLLVGIVVFRRVRAARAARALEKAIAQQAQEQAVNAKPEMRAEIQELHRKIEEGIKSLKTSKLGAGKSGASALYALPWYAIVGPPGAGKTTALKQSGLSFPFVDPDTGGGVRGVGGTRNCDWWFTNEAILLDTAGRYTTESDDHDEWMAFLDQLLKFRSHKPLNGVVVAVSINDLLDASDEQVDQMGKKIRARIDEMQDSLKMVLPVYVLFTKVDLVAGFVEFFGDIRRSERGQAWGATVRMDADKSKPGQIFDEEFDLLVERLHDRALRRMGVERNRKTKEKIYQFPLEFAAVKRNLSDFIASAFPLAPQGQLNPIFRGFYFTSGTQEGKPLDRVVGAMGRAFGLRAGGAEGEDEDTQQAESRSYFLKDVFQTVIFPDQDVAARTEGELRRLKFRKVLFAAVAGFVALLFLVPASCSYLNNAELIDETARISNEAANVGWGDGGDSAEKVDKLQALREQTQKLDGFEEDTPFDYWFMYEGDTLLPPLRQQYVDSLQLGFVLPVKARLEQKLDGVTGEKYLADYNALKAYILLGAPIEHLPQFADWQVGQLTQIWAEELKPSTDLPEADLKKKLVPHVRFYVELQRRRVIDGEPLKENLIERARDILRRIGPAKRYYEKFVTALIDQKYDETGPDSAENLRYPPVTLDELFLDRPEVLTIIRSNRNVREGKFQEVEGPYTLKGHEQVLASLKDGAKELDREKWVVPLSTEEKQQGDKIEQELERVRQQYDSEYVNQWKAFFRDLDIAVPKNNREAISEFNILATPDWPYQRLLEELSINTQFEEPGAELDENGRAKQPGVTDQIRRRVQRRINNKARLNVGAFVPGVDGEEERFDPVPIEFESMVGFGVPPAPPPTPEGQAPPPTPDVQLASYIAKLEELSGAMNNIEDGPPTADTAEVTQLFEKAVAETRSMLSSMDETGQKLMEPLLMNPLRQAYKALVTDAGGAASGLWEVEVYPSYRDNIRNRYPFNLASKRDASYDDVVAFYNPDGGILWGFYDSYLKGFHQKRAHDFIPVSHLQQRPRPATPFSPFHPNLQNCLKRSSEITDALWQGKKSGDPGITFEINLKTVSPIVSEVIFELDGQVRRYRNEKEFWHGFAWPGEEDPLGGARIQIRGAGGLDEEITRDGPWGIFRLFESADEMTAVKDDDGRFEVTWQMTAPPVTVTMQVRPRRANHPFPISFFRATNCPASIGDRFGEGS